jgi:hypothetical protein
MKNRISIRRIDVTAATAVAGVGVAAGLNVTGALAAMTDSDHTTRDGQTSQTLMLARDSSSDSLNEAKAEQEARRAAQQAAQVRKKARAAGRRAAEVRAVQERSSRSLTRTYSGDPRSIARSMTSARYGWDAGQFSCLNSLWDHESGWNLHASNSSSGAYGIPQALPGSKMGKMGADWRDNPATQIAWGLSYVKSSYGTPCGAWSACQSKGWY